MFKNKKIASDIELLKKSELFDCERYQDIYLKHSRMSAEKHYLTIGYKKGFYPSNDFNGNRYLEDNKDVKNANICPLVHYEKVKNIEIREAYKLYDDTFDGEYLSLRNERSQARKEAKIKYKSLIKKNKKARILVYLHVFYATSFIEIKEYLKNLESYNYDLIISLTKGHYSEYTLQEIKAFKKDTKIYLYDNYGYDVGPFVETLNNIDLNKYDIIFKLHSKGTSNNTRYVYDQIFRGRDWFINLFEGVLGAENVHKTIDMLYNSNTGLVCAHNLLINDPIHKKHLVLDELKRRKIDFKDNYRFVAGTCFAAKSEIFNNLKNLKLSLKDFDNKNKSFFSLAHIIERYICLLPEEYTYGPNQVIKENKWDNVEKQLQKYSYKNLISSQKFELSDDFIYFTLESRLIKSYKIEKIKLKDIIRVWNEKEYRLNETTVYKYLDGDVKAYKKYCEYHEQKNLPHMSIKRYDQLIKSIEENSFDERKIIVLQAKTNVLLDGQHRACVLMHKYGEDYEINVLKIEFLELDLNKLNPKSNIKEMINENGNR